MLIMKESERALFYSIALHYMPTSFVSNRFDELTIKQQLALNVLISTVASHSLSFETYEQGKRTRDINEALRVLKMTLEAKPERAIR